MWIVQAMAKVIVCSWARNFAVTMSYSAYQILIMDTREFMEQPGRMLHPIQVAIPEAASYFQNNLGLILDYINSYESLETPYNLAFCTAIYS